MTGDNHGQFRRIEKFCERFGVWILANIGLITLNLICKLGGFRL